jgi:hypothetical protein
MQLRSLIFCLPSAYSIFRSGFIKSRRDRVPNTSVRSGSTRRVSGSRGHIDSILILIRFRGDVIRVSATVLPRCFVLNLPGLVDPVPNTEADRSLQPEH